MTEEEYWAKRKALVDTAMARYKALVNEYLDAVALIDATYQPRLSGAHRRMMQEMRELDAAYLRDRVGAAPSSGSAAPSSLGVQVPSSMRPPWSKG